MAGVEVGHQFFSRAEMVAVGFHSHWLNGIDYMGQSYSTKVGMLSMYQVVRVISIVALDVGFLCGMCPILSIKTGKKGKDPLLLYRASFYPISHTILFPLFGCEIVGDQEMF